MNIFKLSNPVRINDVFCQSFERFENLLGFKKNFSDPIVQGLPNIDFRFQADFYKKIGVDIVAETAFHYPYPFITEKTYRSIASLRPFIILGPVGTLSFIRQLGFKTFPSIIDESYDNIENPEDRFFAVCNTITKFVDRPIENVRTDLIKIENDLTYNQTHLSNLFTVELEKFKKALPDV